MMGLSIPGKGYNIFVSGEPGTGRMTAIRMILKNHNLPGKLQDVMYINNFSRPEAPTLVLLPGGRGQEFQQAMKGLVRRIKEELINQLGDTKPAVNSVLLVTNLKEDFLKIRNSFADQVVD